MEHGGAIVQDYPHNMTFPAECQQPLYLGCQGQAGTLGPQNQHHRQVQSIRQVPGTGLRRRAPEAVIKAHDPLHHGGAVSLGIPGIELFHLLRLRQKQIQIVAVHLQHGTVEHGVNVIRAAFESTGIQTPAPEGFQHGAGQGSFSTAGGRRCHQKFNHLFLLLSKTPGYWPSAGEACPHPCCG